MKKTLHILGITVLMAGLIFSFTSCQSKAPEARVLSATDTTGLAQFQSWKAMNEAKTATDHYMQGYKDAIATTSTATKTKVVRKPAVKRTVTQPAAQPAKKKGWSKAAKGTVIGTTAGAIAGALINKKNRLVGGIIGGIAGGGGGYVIGRSMDKKDGR